MLIKNFNCNKCTKRNICKYKEIETAEIISKVEGKLDNEYCPPIISFSAFCKEYQRQPDFLTR